MGYGFNLPAVFSHFFHTVLFLFSNERNQIDRVIFRKVPDHLVRPQLVALHGQNYFATPQATDEGTKAAKDKMSQKRQAKGARKRGERR